MPLEDRSGRPGPAAPAGLQLRLASASPRRQLLLPLLGFPVSTQVGPNDETPLPGESALATALRLAEQKVRAVSPPRAGEVVVGADTVVALEGRQLGKPRDAREASRMLRALRGRQHEVATGVALLGQTGWHAGLVATRVQMRRYTDTEIEAYVDSGQPLDKAGAYAIQDEDFSPVAAIEGCYLNVVGLPLCEVWRGLQALSWPLADEDLAPPCRLCDLGRERLARTD